MTKINILLGAAAAVGFFAAAGAASAESSTLGYSYADSGVGHCTHLADNCANGVGVVYDTPGTFTSVFNANASNSAAEPAWGSAYGQAGPGAGFLAAPVLHAETNGVAFHDGAFSWVYSDTQGVQGYTWSGAATDISLSAFVGTFDFTVSNTGYGQAGAAFAILNHLVGEDSALGDSWFKGDGAYGFQNGCGTAGAIAIAESGVVSGPGLHSMTLAPTCGGATSFHLETNETFYLWARLSTFHANDGFTNAGHTFSVSLSPTASPELVQQLQQNLQVGAPFAGNVPEPSTWAMLMVGLGGVGAVLRRRQRTVLA